MTTIQVRVDERTKRTSAKILNDLGLDMSGAIKVYLKQIIASKGIPFPLLTRNGLTSKEERDILDASREAKVGRNVSRAMDAKRAIAYLDTLKK